MKKYTVIIGIALMVSLVVAVPLRAQVSLLDRIIERASQLIVETLVSGNIEEDTEVFGATAGGVRATTSGRVVNLIGTRTGTSTTGVGFGITGSGGYSATSTYALYIGPQTDTVTLYFDVVNASTTPDGQVAFSLLAANDLNCETTITTSPDNRPTAEQIKWYDATDRLAGVTQSAANNYLYGAGTTTIKFTAVAGLNKSYTFTNLNSNCIGLAVSGSSTEIQVQAIRKSLQGGFSF